MAKSPGEVASTTTATSEEQKEQQQQQHVKATTQYPTSSLRNFFFFFLPYCAFLVYASLRSHYTLPAPQPELYNAQTNLPHFSEVKALDYIHHCSEVIGYRILGTPEMDTTIAYTLKIIEQLKGQKTNNNVEFEVSHQKGDGAHLFDFMGKKVWKKYLGVENVIVRLSNGTPSGKENAILVSAHLDSTLPSPGASDDAAGIAVMLETIRVLSQTPDLQMNTALVFLFNGAEESLQDASHLFITQHEWRHTLRGAINLEACGSAGAETLFQATSSQMLELYSHVPRPMGSIFAPELFATGLLLSDTDFRQFEQYGGLTGLDIAIVKDSYKYHTRLDLVEYIEPGTLQHFGDNIIAMLKAGAAKDPSFFKGIKKARETLYFTVLGGTFLIMVKASTVTLVYIAMFSIAVLLAVSTVKAGHRGVYSLCVLNAPLTMISGIIMADIGAAIMTLLLGKPLAYFRKEWYCVLLYGGPAVLGMLLPQLVLARMLRNKGSTVKEQGLLEHGTLVGQLMFTCTATLAGQLAGVLSSYVFALAAGSLLVSLIVNDFILSRRRSQSPLHYAIYYIGQTIPLIAGAEGLVSFLDVIVPLTGRTGVDAPSDFIVASSVAGVLYLVLPMLPSLAHRWDSRILTQAMVIIVFISGVIIAIFAAPSWQPFDEMHPKRLLCLYMENTTSNSFSLHIAGLDPSPLDSVVSSIATEMQLDGKPVLSEISDDIAEWDIIYPVSQFLHSYKVPLPASITSSSSQYKDSFKIEVLESRLNAVSQTRSLQLAIQHPGIIWTVIAFDADVLRWDLPEPAERGTIRHHVKEASGYNVSIWHLSMELKLSDEQFQAALRQSQRRKGQRKRDAEAEEIDHALGGLRIDFSGLDVSRMWHHKVNEDRKGMEFVESLDKAMPDWVDAMLLTAVAGVAVV